MSITEWANTARTAQGNEDAEHQRAIDAIESLLRGEQTPSDAARSIAASYEPRLRASGSGSGMAIFWYLFSVAARTLGRSREYSERLANLLIAMKSLPDVIDTHGRPVRKHTWVYWRDLPDFALTFREYVVDWPGDDDTEGRWLGQADELLNVTTFAATLLTRDLDMGMAFYAVNDMVQVTEYPYDSEERRQEGVLFLPCAATWIFVSGERLYQYCSGQRDSPSFAKVQPGPLWNGDKSGCFERWKFWKQRFQKLATSTAINATGQDLAARAAARMTAIDES